MLSMSPSPDVLAALALYLLKAVTDGGAKEVGSGLAKRIFARFPRRQVEEIAASSTPELEKVETLASELKEASADELVLKLIEEFHDADSDRFHEWSALVRDLATKAGNNQTTGPGGVNVIGPVAEITVNPPPSYGHESRSLPAVEIVRPVASPLELDPHEATLVRVNVANRGGHSASIVVEINVKQHPWVEEIGRAHRQAFVLDGDDERSVTFTIRPKDPSEAGADVGVFSCFIYVQHKPSGNLLDSATIDVRVPARPDVSVEGPSAVDLTGDAFPLTVENHGNISEELQVSARSTETLRVSLNPDRFVLRPGAGREVLVRRTSERPVLWARHSRLTINVQGEKSAETAVDVLERAVVPRGVLAAIVAVVFVAAALLASRGGGDSSQAQDAPTSSTVAAAGPSSTATSGATEPNAEGGAVEPVPLGGLPDLSDDLRTVLAQRYASALAAKDVTVVQQLDPAHGWDQAELDRGYFNTVDSTVVPVRASRVNADISELLLAFVAHEGTDDDRLAVRTRGWCGVWTVDTAASTVTQTQNSPDLVYNEESVVEVSSIQADLRSTCDNLQFPERSGFRRISTEQFEVEVPDGWAAVAFDDSDARVTSVGQDLSSNDDPELLRVQSSFPLSGAGSVEDRIMASCTRAYEQITSDDEEPGRFESTINAPSFTDVGSYHPCFFEYRRSDGRAVVVYQFSDGTRGFGVRAESGSNFLHAQQVATHAVATIDPVVACEQFCE